MRVAIYARVSTERQAERGTIGSQLAALRDQVSTAHHQLVNEFIDDGYSGARLDRPGLDALRDAAEAGLFETVWCLSPDRLARVYAYQVLVLDELARFGVEVHFTDNNVGRGRPSAPNTIGPAPQSNCNHKPGSVIHGRYCRRCPSRYNCLTEATARRVVRSSPMNPKPTSR